MALTTDQLTLIEARVANDSPSAGVAYLLCLFLWWVGAHRFYLGRPGTGILMIIATLCFVIPGALWAFIDLFLIPGMIREKKAQLRRDMSVSLMASGGAG